MKKLIAILILLLSFGFCLSSFAFNKQNISLRLSDLNDGQSTQTSLPIYDKVYKLNEYISVKFNQAPESSKYRSLPPTYSTKQNEIKIHGESSIEFMTNSDDAVICEVLLGYMNDTRGPASSFKFDSGDVKKQSGPYLGDLVSLRWYGYTNNLTANVIPPSKPNADLSTSGIRLLVVSVYYYTGDGKVNSIELDANSLELKLNETRQLTASTYPTTNPPEPVQWMSRDTSIVSVDSNGVVTANSRGKTKVFAYYCNVMAECEVSVIVNSNDEASLNFDDLRDPSIPPYEPAQIFDKEYWINDYIYVKLYRQSLSSTSPFGLSWPTYNAEKKYVNIWPDSGFGIYAPSKKVAINKVVISYELGKECVSSFIFTSGEHKTVKNNSDYTVEWTGYAYSLATQLSGSKSADEIRNIDNCCANIKSITISYLIGDGSVNEININIDSINFEIGESAELKANPSPETDVQLQWISSDPSVVTVSKYGYLNAKSVGKATVYAYYYNVSAKCEVDVIAKPKIELNTTQLNMYLNSTYQLEATLNVPYKPRWWSSDTTVVVVDDNGLVQAKKCGSATIVAAYKSGSAQCDIRVIEKPFVYDDIIYVITSREDKTCRVTNGNTDNCHKGNITIPNEVICDGVAYKVTRVGAEAFMGNKNLTSIKFSDSIKEIAHQAFSGCTSLKSIEIPNNITDIDYYAFSGCPIAEVYFDCEKVRRWFEGYASLKNVTFGPSVKSIEAKAFMDCTGLATVIIPNTIESIGESAFSGCRISALEMPSSAAVISDDAFANCSISTLSIDLENIGLWFKGCPIASLRIGASVKSIEENAFSECSIKSLTLDCEKVGAWFKRQGITTLTLGNNVKSIDNEAFISCSSLSMIVFSSSVETVGYDAFKEIGRYAIVKFPSIESLCSIDFSNSYANPRLTGQVFYINDKLVTDLVIPPSVTKIGKYSFYSCEILNSVTISDSVKKIGDYAFSHCNNLTQVKLGTGLETLGNYAFSSCANITKISCQALNPPTCSTNVFDNVVYDKAILTIPTAASRLYRSTYPWLYFKSIGPVLPSNLALSEEAVVMYPTESIQLTARVLPYETGDKTLSWESSNPDVATVSSDGTVRAMNSGEADIIVTCQDITAVCHISVVKMGEDGCLQHVICEDFRYTNQGFPYNISDELEICTSKLTGIEYNVSGCCNTDGYLDMNGKLLGDRYISFKLDHYCQTIGLYTSNKCSVSNKSKVVVYADGNFIGSYAVNQQNSVVHVDIPKEYQKAGTEYKIKSTSQKYNQQFFYFKYFCYDLPKILPSEISLDQTTASIVSGETLQLTATVLPLEAADAILDWNSSDESVVKVSETGLVTAIAVGTATVTVSCGNVSATCEITVSEVSGIDDVFANGNHEVVVYNLQGVRLNVSTIKDLKKLSTGFYIINGKKVFVK